METKNHLYDIEIERTVIGSIIAYTNALDDIRDFLSVETFSDPLHRNLYSAALTLNSKGEPVDLISITDELRRMGHCQELTPYYVTTIFGQATPNYYHNARILFELFSRRRTWEIGQKLIARATDLTFDLAATLEETNLALSNVFSTPASNIITFGEAMRDLYENYIHRNLAGASELTGSPTGLDVFDEKSGGLHAGNLIVLAADTSQGKTSLAMSIALNAAKYNHSVAIYSLEMGNAELAARIAASESEVQVNKILYAKLMQSELDDIANKTMKLLDLPIYFDDKSTSNIDVIISSIRTMVARYKIKGVVIDYLQILNVNMRGANKEQQMADVARRLKNLAKDLGIWIIALSQLNRDNSNHIPSLNRLRDSGQIAEAADIVMLLYRPEIYGNDYPEPFSSTPTENTALIDIAKGRNIGLRKFIVGFTPSTTRFSNLKDVKENSEDFVPAPKVIIEDDNPF